MSTTDETISASETTTPPRPEAGGLARLPGAHTDRCIDQVVVTAEVPADAASSVVDVATAAVEMFFDDGALVPSRHVELSGETLGVLRDAVLAGPEGLRRGQDLLAELALAHEFEARAMAHNTRKNYGWHARSFIDWCRVRGHSPLPADPHVVATHLAMIASAHDEHGAPLRDAEGQLIEALAPDSVGIRLAAINKLHEYAGLSKPGDDDRVKRTVRGIRRTFLVAPRRRKKALDLEGLKAVLAVVRRERLAMARMRVLLLLRARLGLSAGELARLRWVDIDFDVQDGELVQVTVDVRPTGRRGRQRRGSGAQGPRRAPCGARKVLGTRMIRHAIEVHPTPAVCLVRALATLREVTPNLGCLLVAESGRPLTRQGLYIAGSKHLKAAGSGWEDLPTATDKVLQVVVSGVDDRVDVAAVRNEALLCVGWFAALRRSNIVALNWSDLTPPRGRDQGAWQVRLRRSKTDQEGAGTTKWLPRAALGSSSPCPATALENWHRLITRMLRVDPIRAYPEMPVFPATDRHGNIVGFPTPRRLNGETVNEVLQQLAIDAGLHDPTTRRPNPYGAHSLRAGFVTEALRDDKLSIAEVAEVTDHKSVDVLMRYRREVNNARQNPAAKLLGKLA